MLGRRSAGPRRKARSGAGFASESQTGSRKRVDLQTPSVLVVDDLEDNRQIYAAYFEHFGFRVDEASDGEEALAKIAAARPDLIIMDLSMPRMDGWEATRRIKSNPATEGIVVLVLTGFASEEDLRRAREAGADEVCTKPCLPADLLEHARRLLEAAG
jgi:two-component system, cell cycle response regulator DivK